MNEIELAEAADDIERRHRRTCTESGTDAAGCGSTPAGDKMSELEADCGLPMKRLRIFSDVAQWGWRDWLVVAFGLIVLSIGSGMGRAWVAYR